MRSLMSGLGNTPLGRLVGGLGGVLVLVALRLWFGPSSGWLYLLAASAVVAVIGFAQLVAGRRTSRGS